MDRLDTAVNIKFSSSFRRTAGGLGCLSLSQAKGQAADFGDVQRELSSRWKGLGSDDADRNKFEMLAAEDRARFARESAAKDLEVYFV